jgi:hypothetical protein
MSTDILHFCARVLGIRAPRAVTDSDSDPGEQRRRLAVKAKRLGRRVLAEVATLVTPEKEGPAVFGPAPVATVANSE